MKNNKINRFLFMNTYISFNNTINIKKLLNNIITTNKKPNIIMYNKLSTTHTTITMLRNKKPKKVIIQVTNNFYKLMKTLELIMKNIIIIHMKLLLKNKKNLINILTNMFISKNIIILITVKSRNQRFKSIIMHKKLNQKKLKRMKKRLKQKKLKKLKKNK